ncbi:MAG: DUF455 family protein [Gemmatimonadetes bacterium]|nr:DUF455 family protein [Gemmatimonadota bacterium]
MTTAAPLHPALDPRFFADSAARDERFTVVDRWVDCARFDDADPRKRLEFLHRQMNEEVAVCENAARSLVDHPEAPWELRMWLARQAADEARHADNYRRAFLARGGRLGDYPVLSFQYRVLGRITSLAGRLAVQNRTFEVDGLDAVTHAILEAEADGDADLVALYDAQQADEVVHIRFANEWIRRLTAGRPAVLLEVGRALALAAQGFAAVFTEGGGTRVHKYGVAEELRAMAGFTEEEIRTAVALNEERRERARRADA